jgi:hypothetical protein
MDYYANVEAAVLGPKRNDSRNTPAQKSTGDGGESMVNHDGTTTSDGAAF